ncbi:MAG TPA: DEAD/DEAH box helicase family protein, partial [Rugosimonospora sp.]|nr:DEAD/DEAH box helicase family protein [Rugosimonospora sp.]
MARIRANLAALRTLRTVQAEQRPATPDEQAVLGRWSGWGAVPAALDPVNDKYAWVRDELATLLDETELAAARRTVINAHYTDAALVQAIWDGLGELGFTGGRVLEPGCGSGNFIAFAPQTAEITGVELDPTTAAIAAALHPHASILAESFAATRLETGSIDAVVGNVPFGDLRLHDKRDNGGNHAIHNHFILKSLRATRPGGLVAVITSAYTMDATNPAARREMQQMGDLVGAVRLPSRAHARAAGTDALTDVLIFRRREDDREPAPFDWEYTAAVDVEDVTLRVNAYFVAHPERVLGRLAVGDGLYRHDEVSVAGDPAAAPAQLAQALAEIAELARAQDLLMSPATGEPATAPPAALLPHSHRHPDGYLRLNPDGTFSRQDDGRWEPYVPANIHAKSRDARQRAQAQVAELRALLGLRDTAVELLEAEAASLDDTDHIDRLRQRLNSRYDAYASAYGPINRFTDVPARRKDKATGKMLPAVDEETGEALMRRVRPKQGGFRDDPFSPVVRALEVFDEETQTATKADIFRQRVVAPRPPRLGADNPADALAICLDDHGEVRLDRVAWLLGVDEAAARHALGTLVFDEPGTGRLQPAAAYLSGDVKTKLAAARVAADEDDRYAVNVAELEKVVPRDLGPEEITDSGAVKMGAPWIGAAYIQQFLSEILDDDTVVVEHGGGAMWSVASQHQGTVAARSTWGTDRRSATEIAQTIMEQREFVIKDTVGRKPNQRQVVNLDAIMAATEKAVEMRERFADWIWEEPNRAADLVARYNDTFQRYVPRNYDDVALSLPGLAMTWKPDPHQIAAAARIIHEPAVGLYHAVGAGKTATMIMGAMELRRLGLARKPVVVVPNQLLDQWTREWLKLYPQAKLLAASTEDLDKERRRLMVARMATGDWDAVILTESAFEMLPMSPDAEQAYVDAQTAELEERITAARAAGAELTLKRLETKKANREARLQERLDTDKDAGIWWELTGIDYIFRDESHRDKNLRTVSNVPGMSIKGSQRAQQMDMKLAWLRERQPRWGTRATGTPIANSIVELFTEYRYLRPDLMAQQGITDIDAWLATYAEGKVIIEVTPDGGGLRNKTRHDFVNIDKLVTTLHVFADVKTKDDLGLPRPPLAPRADGLRQPEMVIVQPSAQLLDKVAELVARAAALRGKRPEPGGDNILKIVGEGSAAALDLRLVGLSTEEPQKLDVAADRIAGYYHANAQRIYLDPQGEPHPTPGALQMVFCDLGTPSDKNPGRWTSYAYLRAQLVARGVPREKIRFIHEAHDDRARAELFAACRDGRVAVLVASTEKGGTGVNVQDRLLVMHHLDTPYRPCDLEQREGRIDRRGNQNDEIRIERYATERSLDAFKWQKVAYKATLADRVLTGRAGPRSEDVGEVTLSYEEMKAATTGNPVLVEHAKAKAELARLERAERGYHRNQGQLRWTITNHRQEIGIAEQQIVEAEAAIARRSDTRGDRFAITVRGTRYSKRGEANDRLRTVLGLLLADVRQASAPPQQVGEFGGFTITAQRQEMYLRGERSGQFVAGVRVWLEDAPGTELHLLADDLKTGDLCTRLENRLAKLESVRDKAREDIHRRTGEIARAERDLTKPFRHAENLAATRARFQELDLQVIALAAESEAAANDALRREGEEDADPDEDEQDPTTPTTADGPTGGYGAGPATSAAGT